jgi:raffinose/stachyose/melibiose transport system permease protein
MTEKKKNVSRIRRNIIVYIILIVVALTSLFPLYYMIITSLKTTTEYLDNKVFIPEVSTMENFEYILIDGRLLDYLVNNVILLTFGMAGYLFICVSAGFTFGQLRFPFKLQIFLGVLFLMIFPQMILAIPIFQICTGLKLLNTHLGVILVWIAYFAPFGTYIMTTFFSTLPKSIIESARIDGANIFQILFRLMIPIAKPMMTIIIVIGFQSMWNELPFSLLLLQEKALRTLTLGLAMLKGEWGLPVPALNAGLLVVMCIPLIIYLIFQKNIKMGVTIGSIKG